MAKTKSEMTKLEKELEQLKNELINLTAKISQCIGYNEKLNIKVEGLQKTIERVEDRIDKITTQIDGMKDSIKEDFVSVDKFEPVKLVVYGLAAAIMSSVVWAVLSLVITTGK